MGDVMMFRGLCQGGGHPEALVAISAQQIFPASFVGSPSPRSSPEMVHEERETQWEK
jgi:hypothetical protein